MLKTISAALLAVSVLAAPALAAGTGKTTQAPVTKAAQVKPSVLNANAKMGRHHVRHAAIIASTRRWPRTRRISSRRSPAKHVTHPAKRG